MSSPTVKYAKPWLSIPDQVSKLESRGLQVIDRNAAEAFLGHINYYRFTGFCLAFQDAQRVFYPGTMFEDVVVAHRFDAALRDLFTESLELNEIDLRTVCAHYLGDTHGPFGHTKSANFHPKFDHSRWRQTLHEEANRSKELFVTHFKGKYNEFPDLPIWTATEVMSFGSLSRMIQMLKKQDRRAISSQYGVSPEVLSSATHHLSYVRNLCAHHCRLWDRTWAVKALLPANSDWRGANAVTNNRLFATLLLMRLFLCRNQAIRTDANAWRNRVAELLTTPPKIADHQRLMGLIKNWEDHPVWK